MIHLGPRYVILSTFLLAVHFGDSFSANCTANCIEMRREWPQFDFDFYYEHSGDGPLPSESSVISYSVHSSTPVLVVSSPTSQSMHHSLSPSFSTISQSPIAIDATSTVPTAMPTSSLAISTSHHVITDPMHSPVVSSTASGPSLPIGNAITSLQSTRHANRHDVIKTHVSPADSSSTFSPSSTKCPCGANQTVSEQTGNITAVIQSGASSKNWLENYLLRSVFRNHDQNSSTDESVSNRRNLSTQFQEKMQEIYEYALNKQKEHLSHQVHKRHLLAKAMKSNGNGTVNLTIWDLQVDNSSQTIDVIYYLEKDGILLPYEDALKVMSFVSDDYIHNQTGYEVVDKIRRYTEDEPTSRQATTFTGWFSLGWLIVLLLVLLFSLLLITLLYLKYRREKRRWLESINRDLNRVMPSHSTRSKEKKKDRSHWNYGQDEEEDEGEDEDESEEDNAGGGGTGTHAGTQSSDKKMDKSSQYDYSGGYDDYRQTSYPDPNVSGLPGVYHRERLIPIGTSYTDDGSTSDYDRISYVRTQETLKETKYEPNILEIQLSKETQSIVQEIRKELNRYNFKKIIALESADQTTSEA